jgi:hypothetical protein
VWSSGIDNVTLVSFVASYSHVHSVFNPDTEDSDYEPIPSSKHVESDDSFDGLSVSAQSLPTQENVMVENPQSTTIMHLPIAKSYLAAAEASARALFTSYSDFAELGYFDLVNVIHHYESLDNGTFGLGVVDWRVLLWRLFASVPFKVLVSALEGRLHQDYVNERNVVYDTYHPNSAWMLRAQDDFVPGIYLRPLVNANGLSPTANEFLAVSVALRNYANGADLKMALDIDNILRNEKTSDLETLRRGGHYYLDSRQPRDQVLWTWCEAISMICKAVPVDDRDQALPRAITYCGYASELRRRRLQYDNRLSTTWLVLLVEAAFKALFPAREFFLPLYPIAYLARQTEVQLAERAFTRCTYSDYKYGGLCVTSAGKCASVLLRDLSNTERDLQWAGLQAWRERNTDYKKKTLPICWIPYRQGKAILLCQPGPNEMRSKRIGRLRKKRQRRSWMTCVLRCWHAPVI